MRCALALQSATLGNGRALRPVRVGFRPSNARESPCGCRAFREEEGEDEDAASAIRCNSPSIASSEIECPLSRREWEH